MDRLNLKIYIGIVLSIFWTVGSPLMAAGAATTTTTALVCNEKLIEVYTGNPVAFVDLPKGLKEWIASRTNADQVSFSFLGEGDNAKVYLARDKSGHSVVYKYFKTEMAISDYESYTELFRLQESGVNLGFKMPRPLGTDNDHCISIEYFAGRDLKKILEDPGVPEKLKDNLLSTYNKKTQAIIDYLMPRYRQGIDSYVQGDYFLLKGHFPKWPSGTVLFNIKPENIIVNPLTYGMTLNDNQ